jgi:DsbC/DsbD-like thiol-disulfide interchange protein
MKVPTLLALSLGLSLAAPAQTPRRPGFLSTQSASVTPARLAPGEKALLTVRLTVLPGYHIYAHEPGDRFLTATQIFPAKIPGVTYGPIIWPEATQEGVARVYSGEVIFRVPLRIAPSAKPGRFAAGATIKAQGCNARDCFPPTQFSVPAVLEIAPAAPAQSSRRTG